MSDKKNRFHRHRARVNHRNSIELLEQRRLLTSVVVNSTTDIESAGTITLRDAITMANSSTTPTTITFDPTVFAAAQTIVLGGTQLELSNATEPTTITAPTAGVTVSGNDESGVFAVDEGVTATLQGVNVTQGVNGITNLGTLTFNGGAVTDSSASGSGGGGGILNEGTLNMTDDTVSDNTAEGHGGGLENYGGSSGDAVATLNGVTFSGNSSTDADGGGGAIASDINGLAGSTTLTLNNVILNDNTSDFSGGGVYLDASNTGSTFSDVTITGNSVTSAQGGGIFTCGALSVSDSLISGNASNQGGGGIFNCGTLTVTDTSILSNSCASFYGGGFNNSPDGVTDSATASLTNVTLSDNTAESGAGGGACVIGGSSSTPSLTTFRDDTIAGNTAANDGGGLFVVNATGNTGKVGNTIIAGNTISSTNDDPDVFGPVVSAGNNLIGITDGSSGWLGSDLTGTSASPLDADLGSLANNGGPTETLVPQAGSPAIATGSVGLIPSGITTDQRGDPRTINSAVDIGAVEVGGSATALLATTTTLIDLDPTQVVGQSDLFTIGVSPAAGTGAALPTGTVTLYQDGSSVGTFNLSNAQVQVPLKVAAAGTFTFDAVYNGDTNYASSTSGSVDRTYLAASAVVPTVGKAFVPTANIAGQPLNARAPVSFKNDGTTILSGLFLVKLFADTSSSGLSADAVQMSQLTHKAILKPGKAFSVTLLARTLPANLPAGTYYLVAEVTDPIGSTNTATFAKPVSVTAPFTSLAGALVTVRPSTIAAGRSGSLMITLTNSGNITAAGPVTLTLNASSDGSTTLPTVLASLTRHVSIRASKSLRIVVRVNTAGLAAGDYVPLLSILFAGVTTTASGSSFEVG